MNFLVSLHNVKSDRLLAKLAHAMLESVSENNADILRDHPEIPRLDASGVRFREEPWAIGPLRYPGGLEQFTHLLEIYRRRWGDCAQLCAWRVGELRAGGPRTPEAPRGERATLRYYVKAYCPRCSQRPGDQCAEPSHPDRARCFHVQVRRPNGVIEDPSRLLAF